MKIFAIAILFTGLAVTAFQGQSTTETERKTIENKLSNSDTTGRFRFTSAKTRTSSDATGIKALLAEIKNFPKSSYVLAYKNSSSANGISIENDINMYSSRLNASTVKELLIAEGDITIMDKKYPDKKYLILIQ